MQRKRDLYFAKYTRSYDLEKKVNEKRNLQAANGTHSSQPYPFDVRRVISFWPIFGNMHINFLRDIRMLARNGDDYDNFIIITGSGKVYQLDSIFTEYGIVNSSELTFDDRSVKTFVSNFGNGTYALTTDGKVYSWGRNKYYTLGHPEHKEFLKPTLIEGLNNKKIIEVACGVDYTLALTDKGKLYLWGNLNTKDENFYFWKTPRVLPNEVGEKHKIVSIACNLLYSILLTDDGAIYNLDVKNYRYSKEVNIQSSEKRCVLLIKSGIVKVAVGLNHVLALTHSGDLYTWGNNAFGQLGTGNVESHFEPTLVPQMKHLSDIAAVYDNLISAAASKYGLFYVWGKFDGNKVLVPQVVNFTHMHDVFASLGLLHQPLILSAYNHDYTNENELRNHLENAFDDPSTSDFKVQVEGRNIYVHKTVLKICSSYFKNKFECDWKDIENISDPDGFSYNVYKAYLKYLYTDLIDISPKEILDLLKLANIYGETHLKTDCISVIQKQVTKSNAKAIYQKALHYNEERLQGFCLSFLMNASAGK